ncbi:MAG: ABC transporter ATP-binding protein [Terriglobales bacterium]
MRARLRALLRHTQVHGGWAGAALLLGGGVAALGAVEPLFLKYLTDLLVAAAAGAGRHAWRPGMVALALLGCVLVAQRVLLTAQTIAVNRIRFATSFELSSEVLRQLYNRPLSFHQNNGAGYVLTRVDRGVAALGQLTNDLLQTLVPNVITLAMMMALLWELSPRLAWVGLAPMPLFLWATARGARRLVAHEEMAQTGWSRLYSRVTEVLSGIKTVKSLGGEAGEVAAYRAGAREIFRSLWKLVWLDESYGHVKNALALTGRMGVAAYGFWLVLEGRISTGTWIAATSYAALLYGPLAGLAGTYSTIAREWVAAGAVLDFLEEPTAEEPAAVAPPLRWQGGIRFEKVSFRYAGQKRHALDEVSFAVQPGEHIAVVGPSGGGKTTLADLLLKFHEPEAGAILLDGCDLRAIAPAELRRQIAVVLQDPLLLEGSIADNLAYGLAARPALAKAARAAVTARAGQGTAAGAPGVAKLPRCPSVSTPELWRALEAAQAAEFVCRLPEGLDTRLGERGARLSGGERQRLAIARALLRDPRILILDEASAHLDADSEAALNEALRTSLRARTAIIISHRLATLPRVDRILVLEHGCLLEHGTPEELAAGRGFYARWSRAPLAAPLH